MKFTMLLLVLCLTFISGRIDSFADSDIAYVRRWDVAEVDPGMRIDPPWKLLWSKAPIWFEKLDPGGMSESPGRRIADSSEGLATVMRRTLYLIDKKTGRTLWSLPLEGDEVSDWKVNGHIFAYSATYWPASSYIRASVDMQRRKHIWSHRSVPKNLHQHEWVIPIAKQGWLYGLTYNDMAGSEAPLDCYDTSGKLLWSTLRGLKPLEDKPYTWFIYSNTLNVLAAPKEGGLWVQAYDSLTGQKLHGSRLFGDARVGNLSVPLVVSPNGRLFTVYDALTDKLGPDGSFRNIASLLAYDLNKEQLLWVTQVLDGKEAGALSIKQITLGKGNGSQLVATISPNRYCIVNSLDGKVVRTGTLGSRARWTQHNAILYSHPYFFTSARRALSDGYAYDLIALNVETGKIDWSYEIDRQDSEFSTAKAEILNFMVIGDKIYVSRADGKIMAFQPHTVANH